MDNSSESGVTGCRISGAARWREGTSVVVIVVVVVEGEKERDKKREWERCWRKAEAGTGIARVNALFRCWSCLITSYQLKGKRRDARERARATADQGKKREAKSDYSESCEAFDCGDSEFPAELHRSSSLSLSLSFSLAFSLLFSSVRFA